MSYIKNSDMISTQLYLIIHFATVLAVVILGLVSVALLCKNKEFFSLKNHTENDLPLKSKISRSLLSVGMIFFIVIITLETVTNTLGKLV